jgi:hypothetical protein
MGILDRIQDRLVDGWQSAHRWASVQISAAGLTVFSVVAAFPNLAAEAWNLMPPSLRAMLPEHIGYIVAALIFAGTIVGRLHQKKDASNG